MNLSEKIKEVKGPVLVIGASGFIGANLFRHLLDQREDVIGTTFSGASWRLEGISAAAIVHCNLLEPESVSAILRRFNPKTIFDCSSFGAYSFESDYELIHRTNYLSFIRLMETLAGSEITAYVHAGSSSEYGANAAGPAETDGLIPNSHYAVSKVAAAAAITYYGKIRGLPAVNLRLYSVYGPYEDSSRLIPVLCEHLERGALPPFAEATVSRDFVYIDDVVEAFVDAALQMSPALAGESINIGSGVPTTLRQLASLAKGLFDIDAEPQFMASAGRAWDTENWFANTQKAEKVLTWRAKTTIDEGLVRTKAWWDGFLEEMPFNQLTKKGQPRTERCSVTAIIACYRDAQAIPIMYERLVAVFTKINIDYEIIFVNDASPDNSIAVIQSITGKDPHVLGITHSRNFGSQAAFRSGMEIASKESCVLLDGDLQDPPEIIEQFVEEWRRGADVVYGRRVKREMPRLLEWCYRSFYRLFAAMSEVPVPKDAGDFSLIDRKAVYWMLQCPERDLFLRGLRAYVGFNQVGVDYVRPERMFGVSTNNWIKNIGWAKKAIFSFTRVPLHALSALGGMASVATLLLATYSIGLRFLAPASAPRGITFLSLLIMFFGSFSLLGLGLLGEYIGKIFEEVKARPRFIRRNLIVRGTIRPVDIDP